MHFSNFAVLNPQAAVLARQLIEDADGARSPFSSFTHVWMAFNGWMECVTELDSDGQMITALANDRRLKRKFSELMHERQEFSRRTHSFAAMWPIFNVRDVRNKLGRDSFERFSREHLLQVYQVRSLKAQPLNWLNDKEPSWPRVLRCIYMVRCNLLHGSKSPQNARDRELVLHCNDILRMFIEESHCFEWVD